MYHSRDEALEEGEANTALTSKKLVISCLGSDRYLQRRVATLA